METRPSDLRWSDLANVAGALTLARFPLAVVFPFVAQTPLAALSVYLLGIGTDVLDGWWARRTGTTSPAGTWADGVADKVFHLVVAFSMAQLGVIPAWWLPLWFARELGQLLMIPTVLSNMKKGPVQARKADTVGKATAVLLGCACIVSMLQLEAVALVFTLIVGAVGLVAAARYALRERSYKGQ